MNTINFKQVYCKLPGSHLWVKEEDYPRHVHDFISDKKSLQQPRIAFVETKTKVKRLKHWTERCLGTSYKYDYSDPNVLKLVPI